MPDPSADQATAIRELESAAAAHDPDRLEIAINDAFRVGLHPDMASALISVVDSPWHSRHEDVVSAIQRLRPPEAVDALERVATMTFPYPAYDDFEALRRKCSWALADIGGEPSRAALTRLSKSDDSRLAAYAMERLSNWEAEQHRKANA